MLFWMITITKDIFVFMIELNFDSECRFGNLKRCFYIFFFYIVYDKNEKNLFYNFYYFEKYIIK